MLPRNIILRGSIEMLVEPAEPRYGYRIIDNSIEVCNSGSVYRLIYKAGNALVHHKSNAALLKEREIYHPFKDESELSNEIPLMRLVAEAVIIKTATEI